MMIQKFISFINAGSGFGVHRAITDWALLKFGRNPNKKLNDPSSYDMVDDHYANLLLDSFVGVMIKNSLFYVRIFTRALIVRELCNYLSTGTKDESILPRVKTLDRAYHSAGFSGSLYTLALPAH